MSDASSPSATAGKSDRPRVLGLRRTWFPITMLVLAAIGIVAAYTFPTDRMDPGMRRLAAFVVSVAAAIAIVVWFFTMAGVSRRVRAVTGVLLIAALTLGVGSVRRIEFSGDMTPTFDFRWARDRYVKLEEHRTQQHDGAPLVQLTSITIEPDDILEYRGPQRDGVLPGPPLARDWNKQPPKLVWRQPVGGGYASFLVIGPALVTIEQRRDSEAIVAYEADTGRELWAAEYPALFSETLGGDGPRATPAYADGKIFALGATGMLTCVDFATGKKIWSVNILEQDESGNLDWGMSGSPLVHAGRVLVNPGAQKGTDASRSIVAYDAADGKRLLAGGHAKASYASPMRVTLGGVEQLLIFDGGGLAGFEPNDFRELWRTPWKSDFDINAAQPVVLDERRVVITSDAGTALVEVTQADGTWKAEEIWKNRRFKGGYASPIARDGYLYGIDGNLLSCLDLATGKPKWKDRDGQVGHGQMLLRDDLLLVLTEAGELALVEASPDGFNELGRIQAIDGKTWNVPVLAGNRAYVRNHLEMAAYDLPLAGAPAEPQQDPKPE